jgi:Family of unknown function (DUF6064)
VTIPFTSEAFYGVFTSYNNGVWPTQFLLLLFGIFAVVLLIGNLAYSSVGISAILAVLWAWQGLAYHFAFFSVINPLAYWFAVVFMIASLVFFWHGVLRRHLIFEPAHGWRRVAGCGLILFALVLYPAWTYFDGHRYPAYPTFGLPCPTTIFTIGLLTFLRKPYPKSVFVVPILWCMIGSQAAFAFDLSADFGLLAAGLVGVLLFVQSKDSSGKLKKGYLEN